MNKRTNTSGYKNCLFISLALLLTACDGGIFGTGGPDDLQMNTADASAPIAGAPTDSTGASTTAGAEMQTGDSGNSGDGGANNAGIDAGITDGGAGAADAGATDSGAADGGFTDAGTAESMGSDTAGPVAPDFTDGAFRNEQQTLDSPEARINLINTSDVFVNAIQTDTSTSPILFSDAGVEPGSVSAAASLQVDQTGLRVVDNGNRTQAVSTLVDFSITQATFTTLLVRNNGSLIETIPLVSLTTTNDNMVSKVRLIQADTFAEQTATSLFTLQSAGTNPAGMDRAFGPLSFDSSVIDYVDITSGDYELTDELDRVQTQAISFAGGNTYTVVIVDNGPALVVNDTEAAATLVAQ